jgi:single-stranded-DNA-specific exonuclease
MCVGTVGSLYKSGVFTENSVRGFQWVVTDVPDIHTRNISSKFDLPEIVARLLASRNIENDIIPDFLNPTLRAYLPDPFHLKGMEEAIERIIFALENDEQITVYGDYDVDGATASAILIRFLRMLGNEPEYYIPDRMAEGYGLNAAALDKIRESGTKLVLTVDCGTNSREIIEECGMDMVVVDHHLQINLPPENCILINPNRLDESSEYGYLCAAGLAFLLIAGLHARMRKLGRYEKEPDIFSLLDLVALGTVCDVMPLTGLNRAYVSQGLRVMSKNRNAGMEALIATAKLKNLPDVYALGYVLGPRINAGGRIGKSDLGVRLLTEDNYNEALALAEQLERLNDERRALTNVMLDEANVQAKFQDNSPILVVTGENWHQGVIGIIAGRVKELYDKPCFAIAFENGRGKGSARSIAGFDLGGVITRAKQLGIVTEGGGHAMAAGFSMLPENLEKLREFLAAEISPESRNKNILNFDGIISPDGLSEHLAEHIDKLGPYGSGNPIPRLIMSNAKITFIRQVGEGHLKMSIASADAVSINSKVQAVAFRSIGTELGDFLQGNIGTPINLAGRAAWNNWNGRKSLEFHIEDVARVS